MSKVEMRDSVLTKSARLRELLERERLDFIMEAHNGISARIVEEAGFRGIWGSGLTISASLGVRDSNEASWTQVMEILEFMSDATSIPILLDGDTGYGNFNNMRRLVRKLEQREVAGVCIEDKLFPKTNSFIAGNMQPLADMEEFAGKITAGKEAQTDPNFCVVARVEAFIAGWGLDEALRRAEAYRQAGADAILIHSKKTDPSDIEAFMKEWGGRHPVVIVPTKYFRTPTDRFRELGINLVIWANHLFRSSITAMQETAANVKEEESLVGVEDKVAMLAEVFRLQGDDELRAAEEKYLPRRQGSVQAIILAASRGGKELYSLTKDKPKALISIQGEPIMYKLIREMNESDIREVTVVRGYAKEKVQGQNFEVIDNDEYAESKDLYSLYLARERLQGSVLVAYGDVVLRRHVLANCMEQDNDIVIVVDANIRDDGRAHDYVTCSAPYSNDFLSRDIHLESVGFSDKPRGRSGEWIGVLFANKRGTALMRDLLEKMKGRSDFTQLSVTDLLCELLHKKRIGVVYTNGGWVGVDSALDIEMAGRV